MPSSVNISALNYTYVADLFLMNSHQNSPKKIRAQIKQKVMSLDVHVVHY